MLDDLIKKSWINPENSKGQLGHHIQEFQKKMKLQPSIKFGILGIDECADPIRKELYALAYPFKPDMLLDIGNLNTEDPDLIQLVFAELYEAQIIPILIASNKSDFKLQLNSSLKHAITNAWVCVHPSLLSDIDCREKVLDAVESGNATFKFIGHQIHLTPTQVIQSLDQPGISSIRLGHVRQHMDGVEPWCRSVDHAMFDMSALRKTDFKSKPDHNPGGLFYEEACKISQFIGASAHLKSFGLYGYDAGLDSDGQGAAVAAQLIWYLLEGFNNHREEKAIQKSKMTQYIVHDHKNGGDIHFWKNNISGRWWLEIPGHTDHWISCTYEDYHAASMGSYSSRMVSVMNLD